MILLIVAIVSNALFFLYTKKLQSEKQKLQEQVNRLKAELVIAQKSYETCQQNYGDLLKTLQLQEREYKKKVTELLRIAQKPTKQIDIPTTSDITDIQVTEKECKQIVKMIDQYLKLQKQ